MRIAGVDTSQRVLVVAEIGNNHEGSLERAREMIAAAARAGADAVKFQVITPERLVSPDQEQRLAQLRRFQLSHDQFQDLARTAAELGLIFLATPFDLEAVRFLEPLVPAYKIASGDNDHFPLLEAVAATGKPILLSTGLSDLETVARAKEFIEDLWHRRGLEGQLALLHCVSAYPTPDGEANLAAIRTLARLGCTVGYSDHTLGLEAAVLAVALGARVVEKHFTLDHHLSDFRDHRLAADPEEMAELVRRIRQAEQMLGGGDKKVQPCEEPSRGAARRGLVAARDLPAGTVLAREHLDWLRPRRGLAPGREHLVLGRRLRRALRRGQPITPAEVD
jgi:N-acetylneuraminate synthase/N,N'-diacetyllegionaminate synthase